MRGVRDGIIVWVCVEDVQMRVDCGDKCRTTLLDDTSDSTPFSTPLVVLVPRVSPSYHSGEQEDSLHDRVLLMIQHY